MKLVCLLLISLTIPGAALGSESTSPTSPFDRFGDIKCEDEMARLDNLAVQLQNEPTARAVIIFYGGRHFRGKLPKRGESAARAARLKPYLTERRGIDPSRIELVDGGYSEEWHVVVWIVPPGASTPIADPTIPINQIRFRKGRANSRDYRCEI